AKSERVNDRKIPADGKEGPGDRSGSPYLATRPQKPGYDGGTAPPGVAEYVNNGGKHHAICETCHSEC
ncbi:hypothetical protein, partial [Escherichia coli]|uniref:hypothetical protein n=1 Tax=Escherichia coli TaxID=562 RepID=UPI001BC84753